MADPDIQSAMFKSASAENLPKSDRTLQVEYLLTFSINDKCNFSKGIPGH